ncbi:hypothetical protein [Pleionea sediminis]|uniref:hypothetical protein n=1 Tax=Pleionea sediminis TaxID=2569479 RepID=UPI0011860F00|nr:hypothetical protein [Pleionea sediminis]
MKVRILAVIAIFFAYFGYYTYERGEWDLILSLQILWFACFGIALYLSKLIRDRFAKSGDPAFPMTIVFLVSFSIVAILSPSIEAPVSKGFKLTEWNENPLLVLSGWFSWYFSIGSLFIGLIGPNQEMKEDAER